MAWLWAVGVGEGRLLGWGQHGWSRGMVGGGSGPLKDFHAGGSQPRSVWHDFTAVGLAAD